MRLLLTLLMFLLFASSVSAQTGTGVRLVVLDGHDRPVAGLSLTLVAEDGTTHPLQTDAKGAATAPGLGGSFFRITSVEQTDGSIVPVEATTLDQGLRLGLIPNQTRTVLLRLDTNRLFVDPETIFSGTDAPPTIATAEALAASDPTAVVAQFNSDTSADAGKRVPAEQPAQVPRASRWPLFVMMALIVLIPVSLFVVRAVLQARRQGRRNA